MTERPTIAEDDCNSDVKDLVALLPVAYFGSDLTAAVQSYQRSRGLDPDGIVGPKTWDALENNAPPYVPPGLPAPMSDAMQSGICDLAENSLIAQYDWADRGRAPVGYIKGVALAFGNAYRQWRIGYPPAMNMARANTGNADKDALAWYAGEFNDLGMSNEKDGRRTLRHLWVLLMGLGMRESSGQHCCGRDMSASNTSSDTCEAGAWQTSYDAHGCSDDWDTLFEAFAAAVETDNPQGFLAAFHEDVECSSSNWDCYGSGSGYLHQEMSKGQPAYAAEVCAVTLRCLRQHYGPINRREAELRLEADDLLHEVQDYIDDAEPAA
jgi:hypothetical protein